MWKQALLASDKEKAELERQLVLLDHDAKSLKVRVLILSTILSLLIPSKEDNLLILCLIDGDGTIFAQDLLCKGQAGGREAAQALNKGIAEYMVQDCGLHPGRAQIMTTVFYNKTGLRMTLAVSGLCTPEQFDGFVDGFNQSSGLFSMVDSGYGKEAADSKVKGVFACSSRFHLS